MSLVIALTGTTGFIGRHLGPFLIKQGHQIIELGRTAAGLGYFISLEDDPALIAQQLKNFKATHLIHLAGFAHRQGNETQFLQDNLQLTQKIVDISNAAGISRLIYLSSIKVLGNRTLQNAFNQNTEPSPQDTYGQSKLGCEQYIAKNFKHEWVVIRPPLVHGPDAKGNIAKLAAWSKSSRLFPFGGLENRRSIVSINNLCCFTQTCLNHPKAINQHWLVCDGVTRSTADIYRMICSQQNMEPKLLHLPAWLWKIARYFGNHSPLLESLTLDLEVDCSFTQTQLGWTPND